jgi:hypothetical protein
VTEDQKAISLVLELLHSSKGIPRTFVWLETEVKLAGRRCELPAILEQMQDAKLIASEKDALRIRRYTLTPAGREVLDNL